MFDLRAHTILLTLAGSRAQGLHGPDSDVDLRGAAIPPREVLLSFRHRFEQADRPGDMDVFLGDLRPEERALGDVEGSVYSLRKLVRLAAEANPNLLEVLFCRDQDIRLIRPAGERLRAHRHLFLSQRARHTFAGYAAQQLKRIRTHRRWLLEPLPGPPRRSDFGLPESRSVPKDRRMAADAAIRRLHAEADHDPESWVSGALELGLPNELIALLQREKHFANRQRDWQHFQTWQRQRNPARAALEARFGYDTKHGAHLVRLLRMGREILALGTLRVWRGDVDAEELRAIRQGAWSYDRLMEEVDLEKARMAEVARAPQVPAEPDLEALDALVVALLSEAASGDL